MIDWLTDHLWVGWIGVAVVLAVAEMLSLDLVLLMIAIGALAAAVAAAIGAPLWLTILVFAIVTISFLAVVRPPFVARLHAGPTLTTGHGNLVGRTAVVTEPVGEFDGRVKLSSEIWSARTEDPEPIDVGAEVTVVRIDGATAVITAQEA